MLTCGLDILGPIDHNGTHMRFGQQDLIKAIRGPVTQRSHKEGHIAQVPVLRELRQVGQIELDIAIGYGHPCGSHKDLRRLLGGRVNHRDAVGIPQGRNDVGLRGPGAGAE